ncbi:hypothetical protein BOTBODRAFT_176821 [Botryobasidium botryosum FD-172 SS1]|uniref:F-box domain-containing protein n=1 Tax=Botryobasidium botryosum (strain FD-172 SS1) TaxID=930990 RepID=A0A067MJJ7_BOTB1|nr:hypothetical protein BOTBODRAFT_176821 [Botryobasidium botryosum FD-172 SS1]
MDAIVLSTIPHLVQQLCERALRDEDLGTCKNIWKPPVYDLHTLVFRLPNITRCDPLQHADREAKILSLACEYAVRALSSFAKRTAVEIRNRRNQELPINRLPSEILAIIFQFVVDSGINRVIPLPQKAPFNVSQVSRRWRDVVVNTSRLWTTYDVTSACMAEIIIERSRHAPLDIELATPFITHDVSKDEDPWERTPLRLRRRPAGAAANTNALEFIRPVLSCVDRWGSVVLDGVDRAQLEACIPGNPAPSLKKLHVIGKDGLPRGRGAVFRTSFFNGSTPLLRDLRLSWIHVPPTSSLFVGLTSLELDGITFNVTALSFLRTIGAGCPLLRQLSLMHVHWEPDPQFNHRVRDRLVLLPHLRHMKLWGIQGDFLHDILSSITASSGVHLNIELRASSTRSKLSDVFPSTGVFSNITPIRWMHFRHHPDDITSGDHLALTAGDFVSGHTLRIVILGLGSAHQVIPSFAQSLPISLESLALEAINPRFFDTASFAQLLADSPTITSLTLSDCPWSFVEALIVRPKQHLCPRLGELRLQGFSIVKKTLLDLASSRTTGGSQLGPHIPGETDLTRLVLSRCVKLDSSTLVALRNLPLDVHALPSDSHIEEIEYSCFQR